MRKTPSSSRPEGPAVVSVDVIRPRYKALFIASRVEVRMDVESLEVKGALAFSRGFTRGRTVPKDGRPGRFQDRYLMACARRREASGRSPPSCGDRRTPVQARPRSAS